MENNDRNLKNLRSRFEAEVKKAKLVDSTIRRYQSWIRRYLRYCKGCNIEITANSVLSFLKMYKNYSTRRQGFYALQFFILKVTKEKEFINLEDTVDDGQQKSKSYWAWFFRE